MEFNFSNIIFIFKKKLNKIKDIIFIDLFYH